MCEGGAETVPGEEVQTKPWISNVGPDGRADENGKHQVSVSTSVIEGDSGAFGIMLEVTCCAQVGIVGECSRHQVSEVAEMKGSVGHSCHTADMS